MTSNPQTEQQPNEAGAVAPLLAMRGIRKSFAGVEVLKGVGLELLPGEVHILAGENGAGKSTLIKILAGVYDDFSGEIYLDGAPVRFTRTQDAQRGGISVIYQEISLVGCLGAAENIFLGRELAGTAGWLRPAHQREQARSLLESLDLDIDLDRPVDEYPVSVRQMIEIAKALSLDARVIVMDEPTSTLSGPEVEKLFEIIGVLRQRGCGIIYITHKMEEIYRIGDRITVLRDGEYIGTESAGRLPRDELVRWMVGREISSQFPGRSPGRGEPAMTVSSFSVPSPAGPAGNFLVRDVSFTLHEGEILGFAGLQGSGNSELLHGLFGDYRREVEGEVALLGEPFEVNKPAHSISRGMALLTNDRKRSGIVPLMSLTRNMTLAALHRLSPGGWLRPDREKRMAAGMASGLDLRAASLEQEIRTLSGGNQQKVLLARWLGTEPRVLLLDEPTRGVDVAVKHQIYGLMNEWTARGMAILLITSEMPELLAMADRIMVMHRGRVTAEFGRGQATQENILHAAMG